MSGTASSTPPLTGWPLLHSKLPAAAIKPLATDVYGVAGLSDVNEGYLIQRLFASEFSWDWRIVKQEYLGSEDRAVRNKDYTLRYYLAAVHGELNIEGRMFHGAGASDNRKIDAAYKGAATVAFKNACKLAGLTIELFKDGKAMDHIYEARQTSKAESVDEMVEKATEAFGAPESLAQGATPMGGLPPSEPSVPGNGSVAPAPEALVPTDEDLADLFALGRTLRKPADAVMVRNEVAEHGLAAVRRRLILAHAEPRNCGKSPCSHVAQLAGLAAK
jgi:hypothetical protein